MEAECGDHVWTLVEIARSVSLTRLFWSLAEQLRLDRVEIARNVSLIRLSKATRRVEISRIVSLLGLSWRLDEFSNLLKLTSELPGSRCAYRSETAMVYRRCHPLSYPELRAGCNRSVLQ